MPERLRAACFDFDGVIVDSEPLHLEAERRALAKLGITFSLMEKEKFVGGTVRGTAERICSHYGIGNVESFFAERQQIFAELVESELKLLPGAREALSRLRAAGVPLALVSSGESEYIRAALASHGLQGLFHVVVTQQDVAAHKPDPEPYLTAADHLGFPPGQCLAVEDSPTGVASARAAGLLCIAVPSPATIDADFSGADLRLASLVDLDESRISSLFEGLSI